MTFRRLLSCAAIVAAAFLAGCAATGPKFSEVAKSIAPVPQDAGRIYFFRANSMMGAAVQPDIRLDGQVVGESKPGGFFYVDRPAGEHVASTQTEAEKTLTFTLAAGETKYLRTSPTFGLLVGRVAIEAEDPAKARAEIETLSLTTLKARPASATPPPAAPNATPAVPAGPTTLASVLAASQAAAPVDVLRHLDERNVDHTSWTFPSDNPAIYRNVYLVFKNGRVEAGNQHDHTSGTYTVAGDKVCVDLQSKRWGKTCYVVIEATTGDNAHGLQVMAVPGGERLPLTIR